MSQTNETGSGDSFPWLLGKNNPTSDYIAYSASNLGVAHSRLTLHHGKYIHSSLWNGLLSLILQTDNH